MSMKNYKPIQSVQDTPFGYTISLISGKWKMIILYWLVEYPVIRYNELQRLLKTISYKTLSVQLKELQEDGLIERIEYPQIPPKVEYMLSEKGKSLYPVMEAICNWGKQQTKHEEKENDNE